MFPAAAPTRHIPANEYRRLRWRNGLGWTREIHAEPRPGAEGWSWRLSIAEIEAEGPYSAYPGVQREQVLLSGGGLVLDFGAGGERPLAPPHGRQRFDGGAAVYARLPEGRVEVFNLMWQPGGVQPRLMHRPLVGSMLLFADPGAAWAVYLMAGQARVSDDVGGGAQRLGPGDTLLLGAGAQRRRHHIEGAGELLLVRVEPGAQ